MEKGNASVNKQTMRKYLLNAFVIVLSLNHVTYSGSDSYVQELIHLLTLTNTTCGSVNWCVIQDTKKVDYAVQGCCLPCSCKQSCYYEKSCCPDMKLSETLNGALFENVDEFITFLSESTINTTIGNKYSLSHNTHETECLYSSLVGVTKFHPKPTAYKMVTKCTNDTVSSDTKTKCESKPYNFTSSHIVDIVPVQTRGDGIVYRNKHCLQCSNGVNREYDYWDVYLNCIGAYPYIFQNHVDSLNEILSNQLQKASQSRPPCDIYFKPNSESILLSKKPEVCHKISEKMCQNSSAIMSNTCENHQNPIYTTINNTITVYNNLACLVCNHNDLHYTAACMPFRIWYEQILFSGKLNLNIKEMESQAANPMMNEAVLDLIVSRKCPKGHVYDDILDICRRILCPCGLVVKNGTCQPIFRDFINMLYSIEMKIVPEQEFPDLNIKRTFENHWIYNDHRDILKDHAFKITTFYLYRLEGVNDLQAEYVVKLIYEGVNTNVQYLRALSAAQTLLLKKSGNISGYVVKATKSFARNMNFVREKAYDTNKVYTLLYRKSTDIYNNGKMLLLAACSLHYRLELLSGDIDARVGYLVQIKRNKKLVDLRDTKFLIDPYRKVVNVRDIFDMNIKEMIYMLNPNVDDITIRNINTGPTEKQSFDLMNLDKDLAVVCIVLIPCVFAILLCTLRHCKKTSSDPPTNQMQYELEG